MDEEAERKQAEIDAISAEEAERREAEKEAAAAETARREVQEREAARLADLERRQQEIRQARRKFHPLGITAFLLPVCQSDPSWIVYVRVCWAIYFMFCGASREQEIISTEAFHALRFNLVPAEPPTAVGHTVLQRMH